MAIFRVTTFKQVVTLAPGDMIATKTKLADLHNQPGNDGRYSFDGLLAYVKTRSSKGALVKVPDLRYVGAYGGEHYYAIKGDTKAALPSAPPAPPTVPAEPKPGALYPSFPTGPRVDLSGLRSQAPSARMDLAAGTHTIRDRYWNGTPTRGIEGDADKLLSDTLIERFLMEKMPRDGINISNSVNLRVQDFEIYSDEIGKDQVAEGIALRGRADNFYIGYGLVGPFPSIRAYPNGDGIATERDQTGLIEHVKCWGSADGGIDTKSNVAIRKCDIHSRNRALRLWGEAVVEDCIVRAPIWLRAGATVRIRNLTVIGALSSIFQIESEGTDGGGKATLIVENPVDLSGLTAPLKWYTGGAGATIQIAGR